ncbi:MAG: hypothetical protein J5746_05205 [Victivallales bacterium]|nr:hypothetical protein [Victivallales bacterium]
MKSLLLIVILLLMLNQFVVLFFLDLLAKRLYFRVKGTKKGYSPRKVVKNIDDFAAPPNSELAQKIRTLDYVSWASAVAVILLTLFYLLLKELGWL